MESYHPFSECREVKMLRAAVFRSGTIGNFKSEIPAEILLDFEHRFSAVLSRWGYRSVATVTSPFDPGGEKSRSEALCNSIIAS